MSGEGKTLWIVGQIVGVDEQDAAKNGTPEGMPWEAVGIFSTEERALNACRDWSYFLGPLPLDVAMPHESISWEGAYFPIVPALAE